jgi:hypothetical protein
MEALDGIRPIVVNITNLSGDFSASLGTCERELGSLAFTNETTTRASEMLCSDCLLTLARCPSPIPLLPH